MSEPAENTQDKTTTEGASEGDTEQPATQNAKSAEDEIKPKENGAGGGTEEPKPVEEPKAAAPPPKPKYRHDWYQTPTDVYINVMIKELKNEDVSVHFDEKMASLMDFIGRPIQVGMLSKLINAIGSNLLLIDDNCNAGKHFNQFEWWRNISIGLELSTSGCTQQMLQESAKNKSKCQH